MKLIELLAVISGNASLNVLNTEGEIVAAYDGKDSIPTRFNDCTVVYSSLQAHDGVISVEILADEALPRYEALMGPNTKQFWLYDNENDTYIDPPANVLKEVNAIVYKNGKATSDSYDEAQTYLEGMANTFPEPDWLHDGNEYNAEENDI